MPTPSAELPAQAASSSDFGEATQSFSRIAVLLPAWQPDAVLVELANQLLQSGMGALLVIDDGSGPESAPILSALSVLPRTTVRRHPVNRGKGCALKTGFGFLLTQESRYTGVVTADADGQHTAEDIVRVARALLASERRPVLGVRRFEGDVPWRSRCGNCFMRWLFSRVAGRDLIDTQTGLRGLPMPLLPDLLRLPGERYEYEMTVLAHLCRLEVPLVEVPIKTVYLQGNRASHFHPLWDSMRVFATLARVALHR